MGTKAIVLKYIESKTRYKMSKYQIDNVKEEQCPKKCNMGVTTMLLH